MTTQAVIHPLRTIQAPTSQTEKVKLLATMGVPESIYEVSQARKKNTRLVVSFALK